VIVIGREKKKKKHQGGGEGSVGGIRRGVAFSVPRETNNLVNKKIKKKYSGGAERKDLVGKASSGAGSSGRTQPLVRGGKQASPLGMESSCGKREGPPSCS